MSLYCTYTVPLSKSTNTKFPRWTWASLPSTHLPAVNTPWTAFLTCEMFFLIGTANLKNWILIHHVRRILISSEQWKPVKQRVLNCTLPVVQFMHHWVHNGQDINQPVWWDPFIVVVELVISVLQNAESFNWAILVVKSPPAFWCRDPKHVRYDTSKHLKTVLLGRNELHRPGWMSRDPLWSS